MCFLFDLGSSGGGGEEREGKRGGGRKFKKFKKNVIYLVEIVDVALALELPQGRVLLQGPAVELLVRGDDVDSGLFVC